MSHVNDMITKYRVARQEVQRILDIDDLQYCQFQEKMGYKYMAEVMKLLPHQTTDFGKSQVYWTWWINQWNYTDYFIFLPERDTYKSISQARAAYKNVHQPAFMGAQPSKDVWDDGFAQMIGQFIDEIRKNKTHAVR